MALFRPRVTCEHVYLISFEFPSAQSGSLEYNSPNPSNTSGAQVSTGEELRIVVCTYKGTAGNRSSRSPVIRPTCIYVTCYARVNTLFLLKIWYSRVTFGSMTNNVKSESLTFEGRVDTTSQITARQRFARASTQFNPSRHIKSFAIVMLCVRVCSSVNTGGVFMLRPCIHDSLWSSSVQVFVTASESMKYLTDYQRVIYADNNRQI